MKYGYDVVKCPVCGTRLVNRTCPMCGSMKGFVTEADHSRYGQYEPVLRIVNSLLVILCVAALTGCIVTRILNENTEYNYQTVQATVLSYEDAYSVSGYVKKSPKVAVSYRGKTYQLKNVTQGSWYYSIGRSVETYLSNGVMYANVEGLTSSGFMGTLYFICLFGFMGLAIGACLLKAIRREIQMQVI